MQVSIYVLQLLKVVYSLMLYIQSIHTSIPVYVPTLKYIPTSMYTYIMHMEQHIKVCTVTYTLRYTGAWL